MYLSIPDKTQTAIMRPSGCGKSTFLRCSNRMNDLIEGVKITSEVLVEEEIYTNNIDVFKLGKKVGMVFQKSKMSGYSTAV